MRLSLVKALAGRVQLVATPVFSVDGCAGGDYWSISGRQDRAWCHVARRMPRTARGVQQPRLDSGMNLLRSAVAPLAGGRPFFASVIETGGHLASLQALLDDRADVAAIDCVTFAFVLDQLAHLGRGVVEIGTTRSAPGLR